MSGSTRKGVIYMTEPQEKGRRQKSRFYAEGEYSDEYPLGGSIEPYDIWRELKIFERNRRAILGII